MFRFYPTCTALADGTVLVTDGEALVPEGASLPMIFDPTVPPTGQSPPSPQWRHLNPAQYCEAGCPYDFDVGVYPFMFLLSSGEVLMAGSANGTLGGPPPPTPTRVLDICLEEWSAPQPDSIPGGTAVMYGRDKIMKAGGRPAGAAKKVFTIDMSLPTPEWEEHEFFGLRNARDIFYLIVLPDGQVLAVGGEHNGDDVLEPELYDPNANPEQPWTGMATMPVARTDHSSAVLLPDGRVLIAGGDGPSRPNGNIFWPPYLFEDDGNGGSACVQRPEIDCVAQQCDPQPQDPVLQYGETFTLESAQAGGMDANDKVTLLRPGQSTHSFDFEQRFMELTFTLGPGNDQLSVEPPEETSHAPPGYYMLFIVVDGVPSVSKIIKLAPIGPQKPADPDGFAKNRYISFVIVSPDSQAVRVRDLTNFPTVKTWWVDIPKDVSELSGKADATPPTFQAATLGCAAVYTDWDVGVVHVYYEGIVPGGEYDVQTILPEGDPLEPDDYSKPLTITNGIWGDAVGPFADGAWMAPDGRVDVTADVVAILDKFKNAPTAPPKARTDLQPATPELLIGIVDVTRALDACSGAEYPWLPPPLPPDCP